MRTNLAVYLKLVCFLLLFSVVAASSLFAENTSVKKWDKRFGGSGFDYLFSIPQTSDGGYISGGYSLLT
jgi:hypothetical protein